MDDDRDDTVLSLPRAPVDAAAAPDVDDTIVRDPALDRIRLPRIDHATGLPIAEPPAETGPVELVSCALRVGQTLVPLDREVLIGRRPAPPRISSGMPPRLIAVDSPTSDVSRTHLGVRQLGASVVLTDLRSTNGSVLAVPGAVPRSLRPGESVVVPVGTRVDIGDGNVIELVRVGAGEAPA